MQLTTALSTIALAAPIALALPQVWVPPEIHFTTINLEAFAVDTPFTNPFVTAHNGLLYINVTNHDATCNDSAHGAPGNANGAAHASFYSDNSTGILRLYNTPDDAGSYDLNWQTTYVNETKGGVRYVADETTPQPTDQWPSFVSGWTMTTVSVGGNVYMRWKGEKMWACDVGDGAWLLDVAEWLAFPMGTTGCRKVTLIVHREEPAPYCTYSSP